MTKIHNNEAEFCIAELATKMNLFFTRKVCTFSMKIKIVRNVPIFIRNVLTIVFIIKKLG